MVEVCPADNIERPRVVDQDGLSYVLGIYSEFQDDLRSTRSYLRSVLSVQDPDQPMRTQFDDLDAEIMYLLVRDRKPESVVEISPRDGWSSLWLLKALSDNKKGKLHSFDLLDTSTEYIPEDLRLRRQITVGDVRQNENAIPDSTDFLLIDSAHNASFAKWYVKEVLPRVKEGSPVVIHDIEQQLVRRIPGTESYYIRRLLQKADIGYFSVNSIYWDNQSFVARNIVTMTRRLLSLDEAWLTTPKPNPFELVTQMAMRRAFPDFQHTGNPAIFFTLNAQQQERITVVS